MLRRQAAEAAEAVEAVRIAEAMRLAEAVRAAEKAEATRAAEEARTALAAEAAHAARVVESMRVAVPARPAGRPAVTEPRATAATVPPAVAATEQADVAEPRAAAASARWAEIVSSPETTGTAEPASGGVPAHGSVSPPGREARWWHVAATWAATVLLCAVLTVATVSIVVPKIAGAVPLTVLSNSMAPQMPVGSLAVVRPTMEMGSGRAADLSREQIEDVNEVDQIVVGDVIVFVPDAGEDVLVIHRVIQISTDSTGRRTFITQGDNNSSADDPVAQHQVRAVLWYQLPWLGFVNDAVDDDLRRTVGIVGAVIGYAWAMSHLVRALRSRRTRPGRGHRQPTEPADVAAGPDHRP